MRRLYACTQTLLSIADELEDPIDINERGDLLIAVENLIDISVHVTESVRDIVWQHSLTPSQIERDNQEDY